MKKTFKMMVLVGLLSLACLKGYSQLSVSYYASSLDKIGLGYNFSNRFWSELRLYANTRVEDLTPELVVCFNLAHKEKHNVYLGVGGNVNYFTGFVMPVGVQFSPVEKLDRFSIHIELQPMLDIEGDAILIFQGSWGLRYTFGKRD